MRNLFIICSIFGFTLLSCTTETSDHQNDTDVDFIGELRRITEDNLMETDFIQFDLTMTSNNDYSLSEPVIVERNRISETYNSFKKNQSSISIAISNATRSLTVCCTNDGETYDCVICEDGPSQSLCMLRALNSCTDGGGCGVVCPNKMVYDALSKEFIIQIK